MLRPTVSLLACVSDICIWLTSTVSVCSEGVCESNAFVVFDCGVLAFRILVPGVPALGVSTFEVEASASTLGSWFAGKTASTSSGLKGNNQTSSKSFEWSLLWLRVYYVSVTLYKSMKSVLSIWYPAPSLVKSSSSSLCLWLNGLNKPTSSALIDDPRGTYTSI